MDICGYACCACIYVSVYSIVEERDRKRSISPPAPGPAYGPESFAPNGQGVEAVDGRHLDVLGVAGEVEPDDDDEVGEDED